MHGRGPEVPLDMVESVLCLYGQVTSSTWEFYMTVRYALRTCDLALAGGVSVQQVRNYEAHGLIPKAERSLSGYRLFSPQHLAALQTVKGLVPGYGWQCTSAIM